MRLVVDANILIAELLRERGRALVTHSRLELFIAAKMMDEALHDLDKRVNLIVERSGASRDSILKVVDLATRVAKETMTVLEQSDYQDHEEEARKRIPRDPDDWHIVALALTLDAGIWTQDKDFLGCGVATWTTETLRARLK